MPPGCVPGSISNDLSLPNPKTSTYDSQRSKSSIGIKTSFLRNIGLVLGSLYRARYHSSLFALRPLLCMRVRSSCSFWDAAFGSATPEKDRAAYSPLGRSVTATLSVLGAGRLSLSCSALLEGSKPAGDDWSVESHAREMVKRMPPGRSVTDTLSVLGVGGLAPYHKDYDTYK